MSCSQCAVAALLVTLVVGVQGHQIIYVDTENGTLNSSCWEGGLDQPCSLEVVDTGAQRYNSTIAVLLRYGTSNNTSTTAATFPRALSSLPLPTTNNGCGPTDSRCNEPANIGTYRCNELSNQKSSNVSCPPWFEQSNGMHLIVKVGQLSMALSSVMKHCKSLTYLTATA